MEHRDDYDDAVCWDPIWQERQVQEALLDFCHDVKAFMAEYKSDVLDGFRKNLESLITDSEHR